MEKIIMKHRLPEGGASSFGKFELPTTPKINVHAKPIRQATLTMALAAHDYTAPEASAEDLAVNCLAHGETSRLYQALVAGTSICNGIAGSTMYFAHGGCHMVKTSFPIENLDKVLKAFEGTLHTLMVDGPREDEVKKIKNQYVASKVYEKESLEAFAFTLGHGFAQNGDIYCEDGFINRIKETPARKVALALPELFSRSLHMTLQVPEGTKEAPAKKSLDAFQGRIKKLALAQAAKAKPIKSIKTKNDPAVQMVELFPGVKLIHRLNGLTPTFVLHQYVKGGITTETEKDCGKHSMLARLLTYGYKGMPYNALKNDLEAKSASLNGFSGKNSYGLTMHGQTTDFDSLLGHFAGTVLKPDVPEKYFTHERKVILRMLDNQKEDPVKQAFRSWYKMVFNAHPYALDASGTPASLKKMTPAILKKLHQERQTKEEILFTYCGDLDLETVMNKLRKALVGFKGRKGVKPKKKAWKGINGQRVHMEMKREQIQIVIGKPSFSLSSKEDLFLKMITGHLSGQGSELFVEVRDRQGLCYAVQPVHVSALEAGCWGIYIGSGHDKRERAIEAITSILKRLSKEGLSREEFDRVKAMLEGQQKMAVQTNEDFAQFYSVPALHGLGLDYQHDGQVAIREASYEGFQKFMRSFMGGEWNIVTVGPT